MNKILHTTKEIITNLIPRSISPLTIWFALEMQDKLDANRNKSGWDCMTNKEILGRIKDEVKELEVAIKSGVKADIIAEATDVSNFCSFIAHNNQVSLESRGPQ